MRSFISPAAPWRRSMPGWRLRKSRVAAGFGRSVDGERSHAAHSIRSRSMRSSSSASRWQDWSLESIRRMACDPATSPRRRTAAFPCRRQWSSPAIARSSKHRAITTAPHVGPGELPGSWYNKHRELLILLKRLPPLTSSWSAGCFTGDLHERAHGIVRRHGPVHFGMTPDDVAVVLGPPD